MKTVFALMTSAWMTTALAMGAQPPKRTPSQAHVGPRTAHPTAVQCDALFSLLEIGDYPGKGVHAEKIHCHGGVENTLIPHGCDIGSKKKDDPDHDEDAALATAFLMLLPDISIDDATGTRHWFINSIHFDDVSKCTVKYQGGANNN